MSSQGMTREEAKEYAKTMTYRDAIYNLTRAKCIPYRKATFIKVYELLDILDKIRAEIERMDYLDIEDGSDGYDKYVDQYDVLQIINKYKSESEEVTEE